MTVADLQRFLRSMGEVLEASSAKGVAGELAYVAEKLQPFGEMKLKAFGDFLAGKELKSPPGGGKTTKDPQAVACALAKVQALYQSIVESDLTDAQVDAEVRQITNLTKPQLDEVARQFGISRRLSSKEAVLKAMVDRITGRRGSYERAQQ